jgi:hypothetical protein
MIYEVRRQSSPHPSIPFVLSLMELLAIRLSRQTTPAKSLVMPKAGWFDKLTTNGLEGTTETKNIHPEPILKPVRPVEGWNGAPN